MNNQNYYPVPPVPQAMPPQKPAGKPGKVPAWSIIFLVISFLVLLLSVGLIARSRSQQTAYYATKTYEVAYQQTQTLLYTPPATEPPAVPSKPSTAPTKKPGEYFTYASDLKGMITEGNIDELQELDRLPGGEIDYQAKFTPDGKAVAIATKSGIFVYDGRNYDDLGMVDSDEPVCSLAFSKDGSLLIAGSVDGTVKVWDFDSRELLHALSGHSDYVWNVAIAPDESFFATGSSDGRIMLWSMSDFTLLDTLNPGDGQIRSVLFTPDGKTMITGAENGNIEFWNVSDWSIKHTINAHSDLVMGMALSPDGETLASVSWDMTIKVWNISDYSLLYSQSDDGNVISAAFSPDGKILATSSVNSGTVKLWRVSDGELLLDMSDLVTVTWMVAFSPDGRTLISSSPDETIRVWGISAQ